MRVPFIAGNWKMHTNLQGATSLARSLVNGLKSPEQKEVVLCPPFVYLSEIREVIKDSGIKLGAQNAYFQPQGAFTGEISFAMLKDIGCDYVIVGHSERRQIFNEDNDLVNKKLKAALSCGLSPIFCVGELLEEREKGETERVVRLQIESGLDEIPAEDFKKIIIAYEPVWAIGTGKNATPEQAQEVHSFIRKLLTHLSNPDITKEMRIIYGGSVKAENIAGLAGQNDIDGALVGGASLSAESFIKIVQAVRAK